MPAKIPISALKRIAAKYRLSHLVLLAFGPCKKEGVSHVVTYGTTTEFCDQAATAGNKLKKQLGWPDTLQSTPSRVRKLEARIRELEAVKAVLPESLSPIEQEMLAVYRRLKAGGNEQEEIDLPDGWTLQLALCGPSDYVEDADPDRDPRSHTE